VFGKRYDISHDRQELRDFLADRLRLAFDFATLGAYDLTEEEREQAAAGGGELAQQQSRSRICTSDARPVSRRHVGSATLSCPAPAERRRPSLSCSKSSGRRPGSVPTPMQPCLCADR
jgi:hypothetical protein